MNIKYVGCKPLMTPIPLKVSFVEYLYVHTRISTAFLAREYKKEHLCLKILLNTNIKYIHISHCLLNVNIEYIMSLQDDQIRILSIFIHSNSAEYEYRI